MNVRVEKVTRSKKEQHDRELVKLAVTHNQRAWQELVRRYYGKVTATVHRIYGYNSEAEDVVQEVFIEVAKSLKNFRGDSSFSTFLYRITVNTSYRYIKRNNSKSFVSDAIDFFANLFTTHDDAEMPFDAISKTEHAATVNRALKKLSPDKRVAIVLFEVEGLTLKEISEIMKVPLQTIWSRVYNGRKDLLKILTKRTS